MKDKEYEQLSKEISYALRHAPWEYELELDEEGWVPVVQLLAALQETGRWPNISQEDIVQMMARAEKKRHEMRGGKIRAFYGHSLPGKIKKAEQCPPPVLYHGTTHKAVQSILSTGLVPGARQYVHLSCDIATALEVGKRRDAAPVLFQVDAKRAWADGIKFYLGNEKVWLADAVPAQYLMEISR